MLPEPAFWWRPHCGPWGHALAPAAALYGAVAQARWAFGPTLHAAVPVICIGNFTLGGGGKTPCAIATAKLLGGTGTKPFFLTRGYGGSEVGPHLVDPKKDSALLVGDEPLLLAQCGPTIVAADRVKGAALAIENGAGVIVMDDGFQNPSLAKQLSIIALDAGFGIGNGCVLPAGPLRAPLAFQISRADALVLIGPGVAGNGVADQMTQSGKPVFRANYAPAENTDWLKNRPVAAFAGIARPSKFFATLEGLGAVIAETFSYPDHHRFTQSDARTLLDRAKVLGAELVTTQKDWVRLGGAIGALGDLANAARPLPVVLRFDNEDAYSRLVVSPITSAPG